MSGRYGVGLTDPAIGITAVTPNDSVDLTQPARGILIGDIGSGDAMKVTMWDGTEPTLTGLLAGQVYPIRVKRVWSTGTTALEIFALY